MISDNSESPTTLNENNNHDKVLRLVEYLTALARINTKIVRSYDAEEYRNIIWMHDIPHEPKHCFTQAWGQEDEHESDIWVEVKKFREPELPKIPIKCSEWVKQETLINTRELPELYESIAVERVEEDPDTKEKYSIIETIYLSDFPEVQPIWDNYLETSWIPWSELYERYAAVQKVYAGLFSAYQEQQKLGEQYELVFCQGLLSWKTPSGHDAKRHTIVTKAALEFEPHLGKFTVKPANYGEPIEIEIDMLDVQDQPQNIRHLVEEGRKVIGSNLWDRANVDAVLTSLANSLSDNGRGEYVPDSLKPKGGPSKDKPLIEYAPALILRKRSSRGLEQFLAKMKKQIETGEKVPDSFLDLCEIGFEEEGQGKSDSVIDGLTLDKKIFFPLSANNEQRRIIRTLEQQRGVLVQGPPGTGKSHTIANLICHLLATGKRVLVTAKTPRALQVLHDKLPSEIKPLCINLLGEGADERESLEKSVLGILANIDRQEEVNIEGRIRKLNERIKGNLEDQAVTNNKIMTLRESETFIHTVADHYKGTAAHIARELRKDAEEYSWFTDNIREKDVLPLSQDEIIRLCRAITEIDKETERYLNLFLPDRNKDLPSSTEMKIAFREEAEAKEKSDAGNGKLDNPNCLALLKSDKEQIEALSSCLSSFISEIISIRQKPMHWIETAVYDVLINQDTPWKELLELSTQHTNSIREMAAYVDSIDVIIPDDVERKKLIHDAQIMKKHFEVGRSAGFWIWKPKVVREHGYFIGKVKADGLDCNNTDSLQKLIDYLTVEQQLNYIWSLWSERVDRRYGSFPLQVAELDVLNDALKSILNIKVKREEVKENIQQIADLGIPRWEDAESLNALFRDCKYVHAYITYRNINDNLTKYQNILLELSKRSDAHPINTELYAAFYNRDIDAYCSLINENELLCKKADNVRNKRQIIQKLAKFAPKLAFNLTHCEDAELWAQRLQQLNHSWIWAQGKNWLDDFLKADLPSLERHSRRLEEEIRNDIAELASAKAWQFCFSRMQEDHRRNLMSWHLSMKKLGKGTGKHALTHRINAQRHLNESKDAVPAWIMPLHRVYETVSAEAGVFDVIIVDEASQCGSEALPMMYLGKRILVVGDDKQISPEAVGTNREQVQQLMRNYLFDFQHADSFDVDSSLFDHGRIRFNNRVTLREHFRCMPEIIRFSNDLCYRTDPLIPLRQYPPDRLEPLKSVFVSNGYRIGTGQRVLNRPEADALVNEIERCCNDERYQGMTMGVIVLQGEAQAYHIENLLLQRIGAEEMENRRLICGNPYSFQGDERDVIFLSLVAAPNERIGAMTRPADQRRFNVAASRARDQMWLFYTLVINVFGDVSLSIF
jgi:hypothetical protein